MRNKKTLFKIFLSPAGMSLIEIMIVLVIMGLLGVGTTNLLKGTIETQRKNDVKVSLSQFRDNLKKTLNDDTAWEKTVQQYPADGSVLLIGCLQDNVLAGNLCAHESTPGTLNFIVRDSLDNIYYDSATLTSGLTPDGQLCNTFNATSGNDICPYRYNLAVTLRCPNQTPTCIKPKVIIDATFVVRPVDMAGPLGRVDPNAYTFQIVRSERLRYEPLHVVHRVLGTGTAAEPSGGGTCTGVARPLTSVENDVGNNVAGLSGNTNGLTNTFSLQPGIYDCTITAQVFGVPSGFNIMLQSPALANPVPIGNGFTGEFSSTVVTGKARFQTTAVAGFQVIQTCPGITNWGTPGVDYSNPRNMGIPNPDYNTNTTYTEVNCVRTL